MTLPDDMQPPRGLGWRKDAPDPRDYPAERLLGAPARADLVVPASMMQYVHGTFDQRQASACVAFAITRAIDMSLRAAVEKLGHDPDEVPLGSPGFIYANARQRENVEALAQGRPPSPLQDRGSYPRLAMKAVQALGYCPDGAYPYEVALARINSPPPPRAFQQAFDQGGLQYARVTATGLARVAEVARALAHRKPVIFGMLVDRGFLDNRGDLITHIDASQTVGGHMMAVGAVDTDAVTILNSWGSGWGLLGDGRMSPELFGGQLVSDVYVIQTAAPFSGGKAA